MRAIENASRELAQDNLWRAKEILQGSIPNAGYDSALFEKLGTVLLKMGDLPEAGRFLFLSGRRDVAYEEAIRVFLSKHRKNPRGLFQAFPRSAKLALLLDYPDPLREELKNFGFPKVLREPDTRLTAGQDHSRIPAIFGIVFTSSILVLLILGVVKILEIWRWLKTR